MRFLKAVAISVVSVFVAGPLCVSATDDDWADADDDEWTDEYLEDESYAEDSSLAAQADANLSHPDRQVRMALCIGLVRQKFASSRVELQGLIEQITKMQKVTEEQAAESIHVMMIKNCYINIDQEKDLAELKDNFEAAADRLVAAPAGEDPEKQSTLTAYQWELIKEYIENEKTNPKQSKSEKNSAPKMPPIELPGSGMGTLQKLMYFLAVFGAIFGGGYVLVKKLMQYELQKSQKRVRSKDLRAADKAQKIASKKTE